MNASANVITVARMLVILLLDNTSVLPASEMRRINGVGKE